MDYSNYLDPRDWPESDHLPPVDPKFAMQPWLGHLPPKREYNEAQPNRDVADYLDANQQMIRVGAQIMAVHHGMIIELVNDPANGYGGVIGNFVRHAIMSLLKSHATREGNWEEGTYLRRQGRALRKQHLKSHLKDTWGVVGSTAENMEHYRLNHMFDAIYEEYEELRQLWSEMPEGDYRRDFAKRLRVNGEVGRAIDYYYQRYKHSQDLLQRQQAEEAHFWWEGVMDFAQTNTIAEREISQPESSDQNVERFGYPD